MKHQKLIQSIVFMSLIVFGVFVGVVNVMNADVSVRDAQKTDLNTGKKALFRTQDNKDGTVTLIVVLATPVPTPTPTATHTPPPSPTPTVTATPTPTPI